MIIKESNRQRTKPDGPEPVVLWHQPNRLTSEGLAEVDLVSLPLDLPVGTHLPHRYPDLVLRGRYTSGVRPRRRMVPMDGRLLSQRLMGPFGVVFLAKGVKGSLLPPHRRLGRISRLCLQRPVQSLQSTVLLRVARVDPLRYDTQLDPPYRQLREAAQADAGEGRSVVGPDHPWKSVLPKGPLQDSAHLRPVGLSQPIADQQVPRGGVLRSQRICPNPILRAEPPLEVDRPHVVGALGSCKRLAPGCSMPAPFPSYHQTRTVQDVPCSAGRWPGPLWLHSSQPRHQLLRSPGRMRPPGRDHSLRHCTRNPVRMMSRRSATISQSLPAIRHEALNTFVPSLATNSELPAQLNKRPLPSLPLFNEMFLFPFRVRLFPGQHIPPDGFASHQEECVTNVPGLYPPQSSPVEGEEARGPAL